MNTTSLALGRANAVFAQATVNADLQDAVRRSAQAAVDSGEVPGVVAQVWRKGALCCNVAAGMRDIERAIPMRSDAISASHR